MKKYMIPLIHVIYYMKIIDTIFALVAGWIIGFVASEILGGMGFIIKWYQDIIIWFSFSLISLACLWLAYNIGKKLLFVYQIAKHVLVGAMATILDLKLFELLAWGASLFIVLNPLLIKGFSFIFSTLLKYIGNKYWVFHKTENNQNEAQKEVLEFLIITIVGLAIDVSVFYCATEIIGTQFGLSQAVWVKLSVIFAALIAAIWNFMGYKFFVFKK